MKICGSCSCVNDTINRYCRNCGKPFESENTNEIQETLPDIAITAEPHEIAVDHSDIITDDISEPDVSLAEDTDDFFPVPKAVIDFDFRGEEAPEPAAEESEPAENEEKRYSTHPVINIMKKTGAGGAFLSVCIFATILSLASFVWMNSFRAEMFSPTQNILIDIFKILIAVFLMLFIIGAWIYFGACSNRKRNYTSTGGLSVINAACIIGIVISALIEYIFLCTLCFAYAYRDIYFTALLFLCSAFIALAIIYFSVAIATVGRLKRCAARGTPAKLSLYLIVMNYLASVLASPGIGYFLAKERIVELIMTVSFMLMMICLSGALQSYRRQIKALPKKDAE